MLSRTPLRSPTAHRSRRAEICVLLFDAAEDQVLRKWECFARHSLFQLMSLTNRSCTWDVSGSRAPPLPRASRLCGCGWLFCTQRSAACGTAQRKPQHIAISAGLNFYPPRLVTGSTGRLRPLQRSHDRPGGRRPPRSDGGGRSARPAGQRDERPQDDGHLRDLGRSHSGARAHPSTTPSPTLHTPCSCRHWHQRLLKFGTERV